MKKHRDNLDEFINALRKEPVPSKPPQEVVDKVLQELGEAGAVEEEIKITERVKALKSFTKAAAAVAVIIALLIMVKVFTRPDRELMKRQDESKAEGVIETTREKAKLDLDAKLEAELKNVVGMFVAGDVDGLVAVLAEGRLQSKLAAAYFLAEIGDLRAVVTLQKLSEEYGGDEQDNPFAAAINEIKERLEREKREAVLAKVAEGESRPQIKETAAKAEKTIRYTGVVTDASGKPVEGVSVQSRLYRSDLYAGDGYLWPIELDEDHAKAKTDSKGRFEIGLLPVEVDERRVLAFGHPEYAIGWCDTILSGTMDLKIQLFEPKVVAGRVVDEDGHAVEDAVVLANLQQDSRYPYLDKDFYTAVGSDADGKFAIEKIFEGARLHIDVIKEGYARYTTRNYSYKSYPVRAGEEGLLITLKSGGVIKGCLLSAAKPYKKDGIVVRAYGPGVDIKAITDEIGQFEIIGLEEGSFTLVVDSEYLADSGLICKPQENVEVRAGVESIVELELQKGLQVTLQVIDEETGKGISESRFRITLNVNGAPTLVSDKTDAQGRCVFNLVPGEYAVRVESWHEGSYREVSQDFSVEAGSEDLNVGISITSQPMIYGRLVDAEDQPVLGYLWFAGQKVNTNGQGEFEAPEPEGGQDEIYTCYAFDTEKKLGRGFFWQRGTDANDLEIVIEPFASIVGRLVDANGEGVPEVQPQIGFVDSNGSWRSQKQEWWDTAVEVDGRFRIEGVPIGLPIVVNLTGPGDTGAVKVGQLNPGQIADVNEIVVKDAVLRALREFKESRMEWDGILSGQVIDENGEVMIGVSISVMVGDSSFSDFTDTNGRYELVGLPKGEKLQLQAYRNGYGDSFDVVCDGNDFDIQIFPKVPK